MSPQVKKLMKLPFWLLSLLPTWDYICPCCRKEVEKNSCICPFCHELFMVPLRVPPRALKNATFLESYVHKEIIPKVSASQQEYLTRFFTELFADGFESNNYNAWTGTYTEVGTALAVSTDVAHHGSYASKRTISSAAYKEAGPYETFASTYPTLYMRVYWRAPAASIALLTGAGHEMGILAFSAAAGTQTWIGYVAVFGSKLFSVGYRDAAAWVYASSTLTAVGDRWYCVECQLTVGAAGAGSQRLYIDNNLVFSKTGITNNDRGDIKGVEAHGDAEGINTSVDYIDCVVVADSYIGIEKPPYHLLKGQGGEKRSKSTAIQRRTRPPHYP